ncbi:MAG: PH domain-containing protein [Micropepsaceae bacterium]
MSYVSRTLGSKETVLYSTGYHWLYWAGVSILVGPLFLIALTTLPYSPADFALLALAGAPFLYGLYYFVHGIALEVAVTTDRFVKKTGLISITSEEVSLDKIEEVNVDETILGRIFGFGAVSVHGTGAGKISIHMVSDPIRLRREIQTAREPLRTKGEI